MQTLALKAYPQESNEVRAHLVSSGFLEGIESSQVRLDLRKNLGDADMTLYKSLEGALHIEAVTRTEEEDNKPRVSAIQANENTQLVNSINDLVQTLQTNQSNSKIIKSFHGKERGQKSFCKEVSVVQEKPEIEIETIISITEEALIIDEPIATVERNRQHQGARTEA